MVSYNLTSTELQVTNRESNMIAADYVVPDASFGFLCKRRNKVVYNIPGNLQH